MRSIALLILTGMLSACMPSPFGPYYKPDYPDPSATLSKEYCQGQAGPPSILTFKVAKDVAVTVTTAKQYAERARADIPLTISINVPMHTTVQFATDELRIAESPTAAGRKVDTLLHVGTLVPMLQNEAVDLQRIGPVPLSVMYNLKPAESGQWLSTSHIDFRVEGANFHPDIVLLHLPALTLPGATVPIPPYRLLLNRQDKGWYRYETEAHRQWREQRYAQCQRETPQLACKNILQVLDEGYRSAVDGFEVSGNLLMADFVQKPALGGQISVATRQLAPWQFASNDVALEDAGSGELRHYSFDRFTVFLGWYDVPLVTPVRAVKADTTIRIATSLGEKLLPRYYIQLPPLLINGHEYVLQPIMLDLKLFDGGMEPFNC